MDTYAPITRSFAEDQRPDSPTKGRWFGVPQTIFLMLVQYNQRAFDEMGVEPVDTWDEFQDLCATIKEKGADKGMKPICVSGPTDVYCGHWWDRMIQRIVGKEEVAKVAFGDAKLQDNPGFLRAAQEIEKLPANDWFMDGFEGADFTAAQAMMFQGKAAMIHMGTWLVAEMADVIPDDWVMGSFDFPQVPDGAGNQSSMFGGAHIFSIPNPEKATSHEVNVPLAVEWLKRFTSPEHSAERAREVGQISPCVGVEAPPRLPGIDKLVSAASTGELIIYYYGIHWDTALWAAWYQPVQALFLGKINAEQLIEQMDDNLDNYRALEAKRRALLA
jgi:raffinose/stachyose/melibiose transport system substrate-binding protein